MSVRSTELIVHGVDVRAHSAVLLKVHHTRVRGIGSLAAELVDHIVERILWTKNQKGKSQSQVESGSSNSSGDLIGQTEVYCHSRFLCMAQP
jgi:hypothetical protein